MIIPIYESENRTRLCLTVSEIFDRKHIALALFLYSYYSYSYSYYSFFPTYSLFTYLLLQEWFNPGNFDIISKLGTRRREFLILAGKFQLVDSLWGKTFPHDKHKRRNTRYLLREIPVKNRELGPGGQHTGKVSYGRFPWKTEIAWTGGVNTRENCRVNTIMQGTLSLSLSLSLSLIHAYMCLTVSRRSRDLRPLSRDRSATFFKISPNCLKRLK